jgi:hypothetical protein
MHDDIEKARRLAERLPVDDWLQQFGPRVTERRLRDYGLSQSMAKRAISKAKNKQ